MVEIDVGKAYTSALMKITKIPMCNEFDSFKPYNNEVINDLNSYIVKHNSLSSFLNKTYNLCYGSLFNNEKFKDIEIIAYKESATIKQVNYKALVEELFNTSISDDPIEDIYIKKLIANINIGLLEKSCNRKQRSYLFEDLTELRHYQAEYGGQINLINKYEEKIESSALNINDDDNIISLDTSRTKYDKKYYILA